MDNLAQWVKSIIDWIPTIYSTPNHVQATVQAVVAFFAIFGGWFTYTKYRKEHQLKRAEFFLSLRKELNDSPAFQKISPLLHWNSMELRNTPRSEKQYLLLFYEQVALLVNSGLMSKETAHYMFGYDIIRIARCPNFWVEDQLNNRWWELFKEFEVQMEELEPRVDNRRWWLRLNFNTKLNHLSFFDPTNTSKPEAEEKALTLIREFVREMKDSVARPSHDNKFVRQTLKLGPLRWAARLRLIKKFVIKALKLRRAAKERLYSDDTRQWTSPINRLDTSLKNERGQYDIAILRGHIEKFNERTKELGPDQRSKKDRQRYRTKNLGL